ncbi:hypothetical protein [Terriglobus sp.]|uniref:hypothetical protein n=1 Tax=Terriglobus sp. TaxID=1889013 RepID=UPI003AFFE88F
MVLRPSFVRLCLPLCLLIPAALPAQQGDGGMTVTNDGGGETILQSIAVPPMPGAPFSLMLSTEWARSMTNGGTFTTVNSRTIKRDSMGRIYEERVLMVPKGSKIPLITNLIQIEDPVALTYTECWTRTKTCNLRKLVMTSLSRYQPSLFQSGPLAGGKAYRLHEDLGVDDLLGVSVHRYRDMTTVQTGRDGQR